MLIGLLTDFRGYLAAGQWLAPEIFPYCFCHADFADDADFSSWKFFLSHRFRRYTQIFFIMIFLHRISRMNRRHSCLSDYSRNFAELWPLANGSRPIYAPVVFCHADFADDADFSSWEGFVPQISQIYTDFLWNLW